MKKRIALFCFVAVVAESAAEFVPLSVALEREEAKKLAERKESADAYRVYEALVFSDAWDFDADDIDGMMEAYNRSGIERTECASDVCERILARHPGNARVTFAVARNYLAHYRRGDFVGEIVDGEFVSNMNIYYENRDAMVSSFERIRARALQLLMEARQLPEEDPELASNYYRTLIYMLLDGRTREAHSFNPGRVESLFELTDLVRLPDYEPYERFARGFDLFDTVVRAPVDADGNSGFFDLPASFESAKNDGERWRWAVEQLARTGNTEGKYYELWFFARQLYCTDTLADGSARTVRADAEPFVLQLHTLEDDETIARTTDGIKRFRVPPDYNCIEILKKMVGDRWFSTESGALATEYENRHQFDKAAEVRKQFIGRLKEPSPRYFRELNNIVAPRVRLSVPTVQIYPHPLSFEMTHRNASNITFRVHRIDFDAYFEDIKAEPERYGYRNPLWINNISYYIPLENISPPPGMTFGKSLNLRDYVKDVVMEWNTAVTAKPGHFDTRTVAKSPAPLTPGAYVVYAQAVGGEDSISRAFFWVKDTDVFLNYLFVFNEEKPQQSEFLPLLTVTDSATGAPVAPDVELALHEIWRTGRDPAYEYRITPLAVSNGVAIIRNRHQSGSPQSAFLIVKTGNGGFSTAVFRSHLFPPRTGYPPSWSPEWRSGDMVIVQTDRPVYRPGDTVNFKTWCMNDPRDSYPHFSRLGAATMHVSGLDGEPLTEPFQRRFDEFGSSSFRIPEDAKPGAYALRVRESGSAAEFRIVSGNEHAPEGKAENASPPPALALVPDKTEYAPGDVVKLRVADSGTPGGWVTLFLRPSFGTASVPPEFVRLGNDGTAVYEIPVTRDDFPAFFVEAVAMHDGDMRNAILRIPVMTDDIRLDVEINAARAGDNVNVTVTVTTPDGLPAPDADVALSVYDGAADTLSGASGITERYKTLLVSKLRHEPRDYRNKDVPRGHVFNVWEDNAMTDIGMFGKYASRVFEPDDEPEKSTRDVVPHTPPPTAAPTIPDDFAGTLFWSPSLEKTNRPGVYSAKFSLPAKPARWKIRAHAVSNGTRTGEASAEIR